MAHLNQLVLLLKAFLPRNTSVLVRQNTTASLAAHSWLTRLLYRRLYIRADAVICQSGAMADDLRCNFQLPAEKLAILANPIDTGGIQALTSSQPSVWPAGAGPNLLSVGRLAPEKGLDILIHAFAAVCKHHPGARLTLLGTGPEEDSLRRLSLAQGLASSITFAGHVSNPASYYAGATLFVLASRYEGMPNALLEAAAGGLPIVSTPCCQGISSLLHDAPATWLSDSISSEALAESILTALRSVHRPSGAPLRFHHPFLEPFKLPAAIGSYEQLLLRTVAGGSA
jgi:glycosyltransferase involved in cell wall biosynthesis